MGLKPATYNHKKTERKCFNGPNLDPCDLKSIITRKKKQKQKTPRNTKNKKKNAMAFLFDDKTSDSDGDQHSMFKSSFFEQLDKKDPNLNVAAKQKQFETLVSILLPSPTSCEQHVKKREWRSVVCVALACGLFPAVFSLSLSRSLSLSLFLSPSLSLS